MSQTVLQLVSAHYVGLFLSSAALCVRQQSQSSAICCLYLPVCDGLFFSSRINNAAFCMCCKNNYTFAARLNHVTDAFWLRVNLISSVSAHLKVRPGRSHSVQHILSCRGIFTSQTTDMTDLHEVTITHNLHSYCELVSRSPARISPTPTGFCLHLFLQGETETVPLCSSTAQNKNP